MTVGASVAKLANLVHRKVLAGPGVPLVAGLQAAIFSLACFFQMLLVAFFTKLTETKLEVFADMGITRDQSHIRGGNRLWDNLNWFHFSFCGFLLKYENQSRLVRKVLPQLCAVLI